MKPAYEAFKQELLEHALSKYAQPRETISIPYLLKGRCNEWSKKFTERFPDLKMVTGFYKHGEHFWCVEPDGTIIDPTIEQFYESAWHGDLASYRVYDPATDDVYLGKCMNCGMEIHGLAIEGTKSVCSIDCEQALEAYYR